MSINDPRLLVYIQRSPVNADLVDYTFSMVWHTGKHTDLPAGRRRHSRVLDEGSLVYPQPVHDVRLVLEEVTAVVRKHRELGDARRTPGRERSGLENVLPQPELPLGLPPRSAATTSDEAAASPEETI